MTNSSSSLKSTYWTVIGGTVRHNDVKVKKWATGIRDYGVSTVITVMTKALDEYLRQFLKDDDDNGTAQGRESGQI